MSLITRWSNGSGKSLVIADSTSGNKIYYNSFFLESKETSKKESFLISQNPVKENLLLRNVEPGLSFQIVNATGQIVIEGKTSGKEIKINTSQITKGFYFVIVLGRKPQKFIKE